VIPVRISEIGRDRLDDLHELWLALHRYHGEIGSRPLVEDEAASWAARRAQYEAWLRAGEAVALLAERDNQPVGYAVVHLKDGPDDTYPVGERWAEIYSIAVVPKARGQGVGNLLFDAIDERLAAMGIRAVSLSAMVENEGALRLYQRRGFVPREIVLYRFEERA
jgi:ribosomal protein S18 acetylase RimI-like enzyme